MVIKLSKFALIFTFTDQSSTKSYCDAHYIHVVDLLLRVVMYVF